MYLNSDQRALMPEFLLDIFVGKQRFGLIQSNPIHLFWDQWSKSHFFISYIFIFSSKIFVLLINVSWVFVCFLSLSLFNLVSFHDFRVHLGTAKCEMLDENEQLLGTFTSNQLTCRSLAKYPAPMNASLYVNWRGNIQMDRYKLFVDSQDELYHAHTYPGKCF